MRPRTLATKRTRMLRRTVEDTSTHKKAGHLSGFFYARFFYARLDELSAAELAVAHLVVVRIEQAVDGHQMREADHMIDLQLFHQALLVG